MVDLNFINDENTQGFFKKTALFGASAFMPLHCWGKRVMGIVLFSGDYLFHAGSHG